MPIETTTHSFGFVLERETMYWIPVRFFEVSGLYWIHFNFADYFDSGESMGALIVFWIASALPYRKTEVTKTPFRQIWRPWTVHGGVHWVDQHFFTQVRGFEVDTMYHTIM